MTKYVILMMVLIVTGSVGVAPLLAQSAGEARAGSPQTGATAARPIDLNAATARDLEALPGIGARTAQRILEYRQKAGGFRKIEELMNVRGIGEKSFLRLKPLVTVGGKTNGISLGKQP
ncbi:MAG: helix-hairpin-helix domain-containing protein [Acidobacteria bacterium]|nr:helix-hairpin-helix domain-containing protein [Acidobacteriota bacterium]